MTAYTFGDDLFGNGHKNSLLMTLLDDIELKLEIEGLLQNKMNKLSGTQMTAESSLGCS
jgi:hypothetical protein